MAETAAFAASRRELRNTLCTSSRVMSVKIVKLISEKSLLDFPFQAAIFHVRKNKSIKGKMFQNSPVTRRS